jgi:EpsI family protein
MREILGRKSYLLLSILFALEITGFYVYPRNEVRPEGQTLASLPQQWNNWSMIRESPVETDVAELLRADETLNRVYAKESMSPVGLFIAFFKSQRTGVSPHSPKVCLPGAGWVPLGNRNIEIPVQGWSSPTITVNRYIVGKENTRSVVLYWYETPYRVIANEFAAKIFTVADGLRHRRSDTSLVRVIVWTDAEHLDQAESIGVKFVQDFFPRIREHFPVESPK